MAEIKHRTIQTNGINMHIAEAGSGPLVVMCHGFPESWYSWRHQISALADAGFHAVAPDQRGYGQTDRPEAIDQYTQLHMVGDIIGLLDALGEETAIIAGHDWGAPVAWNSAMLRPDRFKGVIGLSVPHSGRGPMPPTQMFKAVFGDNFFYILYFQEPGKAEKELEADVARTMRMLLFSASGSPEPGEARAPLAQVGGLPRPDAGPEGAAGLADAEGPGLLHERVQADGLPRRPQLVPEHGPQLRPHGRMGHREGHHPRDVHRRRPRPCAHDDPGRKHDGDDEALGAQPERGRDDSRRRALDSAGEPEGSERGDDPLREVALTLAR